MSIQFDVIFYYLLVFWQLDMKTMKLILMVKLLKQEAKV